MAADWGGMTISRKRPLLAGRGTLLAGMAGILMSLAACQSAGPVGAVVGASSSGSAYLSRIRSDNGLPPLIPDAALEQAAKQQAAYMAGSGKMSHDTGWGRGFASRMDKNGIEGAAAENVAHGRMEPEKLFSMWMASAGHRRNMLDPRFSRFGLASAGVGDSGERYWALILGK